MRSRFILFSTVILGALSGCGGAAQQDKSTKCRQDLTRIIEEEEQNICDPILVEQFENRVKNWRDVCLGYANLKERAEVDKKLNSTRECSENKNRWDALRKECSQRVEEIALAGDCLGEACAMDLNDIKQVILDCGAPEADGPHMETARKLVLKLEERIAKAEVLTALVALMDECARIHAMAGKIDTQAILERIFTELAKQKDLKETPEGSEVQRARQDTLVSCGNVFEPAVQATIDKALAGLDEEKLRKKPDKLIEGVQKLEELHARLTELGAEALFPGSTQALTSALSKLKELKNSQVDAKKENTVSDENRTAETDLSFLKGSEGRCKKLAKDKAKFETKAESHAKNGNEKKSNAYKKKLYKTTEELSALIGEIKQIAETTAAPKETLAPIVSKLEKAGCSTK